VTSIIIDLMPAFGCIDIPLNTLNFSMWEIISKLRLQLGKPFCLLGLLVSPTAFFGSWKISVPRSRSVLREQSKQSKQERLTTRLYLNFENISRHRKVQVFKGISMHPNAGIKSMMIEVTQICCYLLEISIATASAIRRKWRRTPQGNSAEGALPVNIERRKGASGTTVRRPGSTAR